MQSLTAITAQQELNICQSLEPSFIMQDATYLRSHPVLKLRIRISGNAQRHLQSSAETLAESYIGFRVLLPYGMYDNYDNSSSRLVVLGHKTSAMSRNCQNQAWMEMREMQR